MTIPVIDLQAEIEKSSDGDWLREMIGFAAERLMEIDIEDRCGAGFGERSDDRTNQRNGYRGRSIGVGAPIDGRHAPVRLI